MFIRNTRQISLAYYISLIPTSIDDSPVQCNPTELLIHLYVFVEYISFRHTVIQYRRGLQDEHAE